MVEKLEGVVQEIDPGSGKPVAETPRERPQQLRGGQMATRPAPPQGPPPTAPGGTNIHINSDNYDLIPVIQPPEGIDLWSDDPISQGHLDTVEEIIKGISDNKLKGIVLPHGWIISAFPVAKKKEELNMEVMDKIAESLEDSDG